MKPGDHRETRDEQDRTDVGQALAGDLSAFGRLVERHRDRLFSLVLRVLHNREDALDVVQDALLRAHQKLSTYRTEHRFCNWLYRIAQNLAITRLRRRGVEVDGAEPDSLPSAMHGPEDQAVRRDQRARVDEAIGRLPYKYRITLLLRHQEDCSLAEIAYVLEIPVGTVKFRLHHGYLLLRGRLRAGDNS